MTVTCTTCGTSYPDVLHHCPGCAAGAPARAKPPKQVKVLDRPVGLDQGGARLLGLFFILPGLVVLGLSVKLSLHSYHLVHDGQAVQGQVVAMETKRSNKAGYTYYPVVRYPTVDGHLITVRSRSGSSPPSAQVGDRLTVYYDREHPEDFMLGTFMDLWFAPLITGIMGPLFTVLGGLMLTGKIKNSGRARRARRRI